MIFSIQRYLEDYFAGSSLTDIDQYAIKLANLYAAERASHASRGSFLKRMRRVRTSFFSANQLNRADFEGLLLARLDKKFKKKIEGSNLFPGGVNTERKRVKQERLSIQNILHEFRHGVEARAVDSFWNSRSKHLLQSRPEKIGQALIAVFIKAVLDGKGLVFREVGSGVGFVDIMVILSKVPHLIELKILKGKLSGASQLQTYMRTERKSKGWLVLFDARPHQTRKEEIPEVITVPEGAIKIMIIDICPVAPSQK